MGEVFKIFFVINVISFLIFAFRNELENKIKKHSYFLSIVDELALLVAIGGSFGALIAMRKYKKGIDDDGAFKIAIPVSIVLQVAGVIYLLLYDLGIVK